MCSFYSVLATQHDMVGTRNNSFEISCDFFTVYDDIILARKCQGIKLTMTNLVTITVSLKTVVGL